MVYSAEATSDIGGSELKHVMGRPIFAEFLGCCVLAAAPFMQFDERVRLLEFLLGGGIALTSHGTKGAVRLAEFSGTLMIRESP